jgi:aconitate hydratase
VESFVATAAVETQLEVELLCAGGVIPAILARMLARYGHTGNRQSANA